MRVRDRRQRFPRPSVAPRRWSTRLALWPRDFGAQDRKGLMVSRCVSLGLALVLVAALAYALFKFFEMLRVRHMDFRALWFVPAGMAVVILVVLIRVVRPLLREILSKTSPK